MGSLKSSAFGLIYYGPHAQSTTLTHRGNTQKEHSRALQKLRNGFTASFSVYFLAKPRAKKLHARHAWVLPWLYRARRVGSTRYLSNTWTYFSRLLTQFKTCAKKIATVSVFSNIVPSNIAIVVTCCAVNSHLICNVWYVSVLSRSRENHMDHIKIIKKFGTYELFLFYAGWVPIATKYLPYRNISTLFSASVTFLNL